MKSALRASQEGPQNGNMGGTSPQVGELEVLRACLEYKFVSVIDVESRKCKFQIFTYIYGQGGDENENDSPENPGNQDRLL